MSKAAAAAAASSSTTAAFAPSLGLPCGRAPGATMTTKTTSLSAARRGVHAWRAAPFATATAPPTAPAAAAAPQPAPRSNSNSNSSARPAEVVAAAQVAAAAAATAVAGTTLTTTSRARAATGVVVVLGLSHHTASVDVRERLAVKEDDWQAAAASLTALPDVSEAAVLSTCNRFEVYLFADHGFNAIAQVVSYLAQTSGIPVTQLRRHLFMLTGNEATWHLLRVSAGLDSLVIGEGQILSQVKRCYELATDKNGQAGKVLARLLNTAVSAGKRVRSETAIAKGAVSISSAAVELAEMRAVRDVHLDIADARVCILGAGKMSRLLVQHLVSRHVRNITIVNRSRGRAEELRSMFPDNHIEIVLADEGMMPAIAKADIVFASTSATEPIIKYDNLSVSLPHGHKCMLIDISVPRNIAADVADIPDVVSYNVDDLKAVVAKNQAKRRRLMLEAEALLREEQTSFNNWHHSLCCVPAISKLQQRAEAIRVEELERVKGKLSGLSTAERKAVETLSRGIINKMLHSPMTHLRELEDVEERSQTLEAIEALFRL